MTCSQRPSSRWLICVFLIAFVVGADNPPGAAADEFQLSVFTVDVTIPLNHRCMGVLPTKSTVIVDPLYAHGFVLQSDAPAIVLCAVDWCEIRNDSYDQWRKALAEAANTTMDRVLVSSLHQHDAPVVDAGAERLLNQVGLSGELFDTEFHDKTVQRVAQAVTESLQHSQPITHLGMGQAAVQRIASNRRVVLPDGTVSFGRGSRSGGDPVYEQAPVGQIDPNLKTLSFWNEDQPVLALHAYATHPMSYYGRGEVTSDFVGLARAKRQRDDFSVQQIYLSGCSGDVTAGKFNEGTPEHRQELTQRLYDAMVAAWKNTTRVPLTTIEFRKASLNLEMHPSQRVDAKRLQQQLRNETLTTEARILAAMGLASHERLQKKRAIDFPCVDLGEAQVLLFPGESFVGYQLLAQELAPEKFVVSIGYGECWPGYIPTAREFNDGFDDSWLWAAPGSEDRIRKALTQVLGPSML